MATGSEISPIATGISTIATGIRTLATRVSPIATGVSTIATGVSIIATGVSPTATGVSSITRVLSYSMLRTCLQYTSLINNVTHNTHSIKLATTLHTAFRYPI